LKLIAKILYVPFGLAFGFVANRAASQIFGILWPSGEVPSSRDGQAPVHTIVAGNALHAATHSATRAVFDRAGANTFRWLFGAWPD
jgi:hypothetical protein